MRIILRVGAAPLVPTTITENQARSRKRQKLPKNQVAKQGWDEQGR